MVTNSAESLGNNFPIEMLDHRQNLGSTIVLVRQVVSMLSNIYKLQHFSTGD